MNRCLYKNGFLKTNSKKGMYNEKLTDLKKWYKASKYHYKPKQYLRFQRKMKPFNKEFQRKNLRLYNVKNYSIEKNMFMRV